MMFKFWVGIFLCHLDQTGSGLNHSSNKWDPGAEFPGVKQLWDEADLFLLLGLRMCGAIPPFPQLFSWYGSYFSPCLKEKQVSTNCFSAVCVRPSLEIQVVEILYSSEFYFMPCCTFSIRNKRSDYCMLFSVCIK
jgi:hypothetical protein